MSKQVHFFASCSDLERIAGELDSNLPLTFVKNGLHDVAQLDVFEGLSGIPNLGINQTGRPAGAGSFLVLPRGADLPVKEVKMAYDQGTKYRFNMTAASNWIYFEPGGQSCGPSNELVFVVGKVGTNLSDPRSVKLYMAFKKVFTRGFSKGKKNALIAPAVLTKTSAELIW